MRKLKTAAIALAAAALLSVFTACTPKASSSSSDSRSNKSNQEGLASSEIQVSMAQEANENKTGFTLNSVIDSGNKTDDNKHFVYLNATITNNTNEDFHLSMLNNFYILFPDSTEAHYDIRTQIYAQNNFSNYTSSPMDIPANSTFTGYIGGFLVPESATDFTVCFFPTLNDNNKDVVIKCPVKAVDMIAPPSDLK
ncbi:DUF4352 domain-containing protein [Ruminococcus sp. XPD3002]|uniref:DUF4352 domain-containing protein n=1 Tax=Ruminococcus sp. XPD3002 TaxID=1452269 RepID=UPI00091D3BDF|nr:protein of unknown function [Ruminococcus flavefaciens]HRU97241.1 DUF4352 domain-containing protein [Ruminococcus sp.]